MPQSVGAYWAAKLDRDLLKIANTIRILTRNGGTPCAGAYDTFSGLYDPRKDRKYHVDHPSAPVCVDGLIGVSERKPIVFGFHFPSLKDPQFQNLPLGEVDSNASMLLVSRKQDLTGIVKYEFPFNSGEWFVVQPGMPRSISLSDVKIFQVAVSQKE